MALFLSQICKPRDSSKLTRFFRRFKPFCKGNKIHHIQKCINKKNDPHIWASLRGLAGSRVAKIRTIIDNTNFLTRKITNSPSPTCGTILILLLELLPSWFTWIWTAMRSWSSSTWDMMPTWRPDLEGRGKSEEERGKILNIFNDIYRKDGRKLVDWK